MIRCPRRDAAMASCKGAWLGNSPQAHATHRAFDPALRHVGAACKRIRGRSRLRVRGLAGGTPWGARPCSISLRPSSRAPQCGRRAIPARRGDSGGGTPHRAASSPAPLDQARRAFSCVRCLTLRWYLPTSSSPEALSILFVYFSKSSLTSFSFFCRQSGSRPLLFLRTCAGQPTKSAVHVY